MGSGYFQLLILAAVALFLILRLRNVLGTRGGFEPPLERKPVEMRADVVDMQDDEDGGLDQDIADHVDPDSDTGKALAEMKVVEPDFSVSGFLEGSRHAYEIILMAFEEDDLDMLRSLLSDDVYDSFEAVVLDRQEKGLTVEASFIGVREAKLSDVRFDKKTEEAEITVRFVAELTSVVKLPDGSIVEGDPNTIKRQRDTWTFARIMGDEDPNWMLVATGE